MVTTGIFPFVVSFDPAEKLGEDYVVVQLLKNVQAKHSGLRHVSAPFDTSTPEKYASSLAAGQAIRDCGVDVIPVGFTVADVDPITKPVKFIEYLKAQVRLTVELKCPHIMLLPEAWRKDVGHKALKGTELDRFLALTATAIADGLVDAPNGFRITLEMLSPHEFRTLNNLTVMIRLVCLVREILAKRGQWIEVGLTIDSAHLFYPRVASRPCMDAAFDGKAVGYDELLEQFAFAVRNGYVFALHVSLEYSRSHPLQPSIDGEKLPLDDFLSTALEEGFSGPIDVEVMLPTHPVIVGSKLEGVPSEPNWDVSEPEEPLVSTLHEIDQVVSQFEG